MKKKLTVFLLLALVFTLFCGFSENQKVYDYADLLDEAEEQELQAGCIRIAKAVECDIVLLTIDDAEGKSAMEYADDFYDENGFGYDAPQGTGVLLLIDMDNREIWLSTCGEAITNINDARIDQILDNLYGDLKAGNYADTFRSFLNDMEHYREGATAPTVPKESTQNYPETHYYNEEPASASFNPWLSLAISAVIALIIVIGMVKGAGGRMTVGSGTYLNHNSVKMLNQYDHFVNKTVSVRYIPPPPKGGGGGFSSTHSSGGGISHGGGGRGF